MTRKGIFRAFLNLPLRLKLILSFLAVIAIGGVIALFIGTKIEHRAIFSLAEDKVRHDLASAWMVYNERLNGIRDVVRLSAARESIREALQTTDRAALGKILDTVRREFDLDILTLANASGNIVIRARRPDSYGDDQAGDPFVKRALLKQEATATQIVSREELIKEGQDLADQAYFQFVPTLMAAFRQEDHETNGMMLKSASPVLDKRGNVAGTLYAGILLSRNFEIVDRVKDIVFKGDLYKGRDIGTATIFQEDLRIATNVMDERGGRATGTRVSREVGQAVLREGRAWVGRAFVVTDWFISAYEPIKDVSGRIIGMLYVGMLEKPYLDQRDRVMATFTALTGLSVIVLLLILSVLTLTITHPLRAMVHATDRIAQGDLTHLVPIDTRDEIGQLARSFNRMTDDIRKANDDLVQWGKTLERRVEERTHELREMQDHLIQSEKLASLGKIAAGVAHEINNPLTSILINTYLMLEKTEPDDPFRENLTLMADETLRCAQIVKRLLEFARQSPAQKAPADINEVIERACQLLENQASVRNVVLVKDLDPALPLLEIDKNQIQQVIWNLTINAIEAMPSGGTLTIRGRFGAEPGTVEVVVTDTGIGIPHENLTLLFDPFFTTKSAGTGLGLAVTYGIVQQHGGTIDVKSEVGRGAAFTIKFPVANKGESDADSPS